MAEEKLCKACGKAAWGYAGSGLYVGTLCKRCYKKNPEVPEESSGYKASNGNSEERNRR